LWYVKVILRPLSLSVSPSLPLSFPQFFITLAPCPHLDNKHTIFGRISAGMGVIERMGNVATDRTDRPAQEVKILKARAL
jgi:cyclophilin family peptidyl-prolyl cis-trans isomerase